jgi:hypothetical protein
LRSLATQLWSIVVVPLFFLVVLISVFASACSDGKQDLPKSQSVASPLATHLNLDGIVRIGERWRYRAVRGSNTVEIDLRLPMDKVAPERFVSLDKLVETADKVVVIADSYASRGTGRCADGREVFVHVLSLPKQTLLLSRSVASCVDGTTSPEPYASFAAGVLSVGDERFSVSANTIRRL